MDIRKPRLNAYGTEQDELPVAQTTVAAVMAAAPAAAPEERFDGERGQKIGTGKQLETANGLIIHNQNSNLEVAEFNWHGYSGKTLQVGEKSTISFSLGSQGMSAFSFDYFALHNSTTVINFYDADGNLIGSEKLFYTGSVSKKQFEIKTLSFTAPAGRQIARAELITGDEPAVGDAGFHIDNVRWTAASQMPVSFTFDRMDKDTGASGTDFITKDGSAGRSVEGTLSRALSASETLQFWDGEKWVNASVTGMKWKAQDGAVHADSWEYKLRVVDGGGNASPEQSHQVELDVTPPPVQVIFDRMTKDDGVADDWKTGDGSAGRLVSGRLDRAPDAGDVAEYSTDGGRTWHKLPLNGLDWSFNDAGRHAESWNYQIRFTDIAGNVSEPAVQDVILLPPQVVLTFDRMDKDTGSSLTDFITKDGSAGRTVTGKLSRALVAGETLEFWDGSTWVNATVTGLTWQAQDATAHNADWQYQVRVVNAGTATAQQAQDVTLDVTPSDVQITFARMTKDDGVADDWRTADGSAGRTVSGQLSRALSPGDIVEYSLDGGITWLKLTVSGLNWSFTDAAAHAEDWQYQVRITDVAGNVAESATQDVILLPPLSLSFDRMDKDTGDSDFITRDGSAGRTVEGSLSRALAPGERLELWDGTKWVEATANGLRWQAQDDTAHTADWQYKVRVVGADNSTVEDRHQDVVLTPALPVHATFTRMDKDTGSSLTDFITKDGSAERIVEGTLSRALEPDEKLEFWDGTKWTEATVSGLTWQAQDATAHGSSWQYQVRISGPGGAPLHEQVQGVLLDVTPSDVQISFARMEKDDGVAGDWQTTDGSAGRTVSGTLSKALTAGDIVEYSPDGGKTWLKLTVTGLNWSFTDAGAHAEDWQYQVRITDVAGNVSESATQEVLLLTTAISLTFTRMEKDTGDSDTDFITKDGSAGRLVEGTMSRALLPGETLKFWNGVQWINATVNGTTWQAQDDRLHPGSWQYKLRVTDNTGSTLQDLAQNVTLIQPLPVQATFERMDKDTGSSASDFITKDGTAGRQVEGALSRALEPGEKLEFWNGTAWVSATVSGMTWQAQDTTAHAASWQYKVRITDDVGKALHEKARSVVLDVTPSAVNITFERMEKDDGTPGDWKTSDGSAGRTVSGRLDRSLNAGDVVEFSLDGGLTWRPVTLDGLTWSFTDPVAHDKGWQYQVRITDVAGNVAAPVTQDVALLATEITLAFTRMDKDTGDSDFITEDGSAGRKVEGTLSRLLFPGEKLEFWNGKAWILAAVDGLTWQAQDNTEHNADWEYKLRVTDFSNNEIIEQQQQVVLEGPTPEGALLSNMGKDSGLDVDNLFTNDGRSGRIYWGTFDKADLGARVEVSTDGGLTWHEALIDDNKWVWQDSAAHTADWTLQTRITNKFGKSTEGAVHQVQLDTTPPNAPEMINRVGNYLTVSLKDSNVVAGDKIIVHIDNKNAFYTLTNADILAGQAVITLPANIPLSAEYRAAFMDIHGNISDYYSRKEYIVDFEDAPLFQGVTAGKPYDVGLVSLTWSGNSNYNGIVNWDSHELLNDGRSAMKIELNKGFKSNKVSFFIGGLNRTSMVLEFYDGATKIHTHIIDGKRSNQNVTVTLPAGKKFTSIIFPGGSNDEYDVDNFNFHSVTNKMLPTETVQNIVKDDLISVGDNLDNIFIVNNVSDLSKIETLNGNGGNDTLKLAGANQTLDLTAFLGKIQSMEVIDITGSGNNTLSLSLGDILQQGGKDLFNLSGNVQMVVKGNAGDKVNLSDLLPDNADVGDWSSSGSVTIGGVVYAVWQHSALDAELLVQNGVTTTLINH